jgi:hypothetical protein
MVLDPVTDATLDELMQPGMTGALVHRSSSHWTALRHVRGQWWLLDSLQTAPRLLTRAETLAYVAESAVAFPVRSLGRAAANTCDRPGSGSHG